ncbi:MAG: hypothetical protein J6K89_03100 [Oscillospiraceae bacterium]|nr:hypothetical protein [Oscillospiraceae bacterium]
MDHGKHFIASKKFIAAEGGPGRIVWLPKLLKEQLLEFLGEVGHPVLGMEPFDM